MQGSHVPIVSAEQWEQVQEKRKLHSDRCKKVDEPDRISLLSGLVKCPVCGSGMIASKNKHINKNRGGYYKTLHYYVCGYSKKQNGMTCKFRHTYNQEKVDAAVLEMVSNLVTTPSFQKSVENYFCDKGSVDELTEQLKQYRKQLYHQEQQKRKFGEVLDNLDIFSDDYNEEYDRIQGEIDRVYDNIEDLESAITGMKRKLELAKKGSEAVKQIKNLIGSIPALFEEMTCEEKRNTYRLFIEKIEMFPEERKDGRIIKSISFKFPVFYDDWAPQKEMSAEEAISYTLEFSEMGITSAEAKATYAELKKYIFETHGVKVSSLYIAQIKRKYGIDMGVNYNTPNNLENRVPKCPRAKEEIIMAALKHFRMLAPEVEMAE